MKCKKFNWVYLSLLIIIVIGSFLRLYGINWDENQHLHPDERHLTMVTAALKWPSQFSEYMDEKRSTLNPRNVGYGYFTYGTLPSTITKGLSVVLNMEDYNKVHLLGRFISAVFSILTILLVFLLTQYLLKDTRMALLASFFEAFSVLSIQHAHFYLVDTAATFFITSALYFLLRTSRSPRLLNFILTGLFFGIAMACKLSVFTFAFVTIFVSIVITWKKYSDKELDRTFLIKIVTGLILFGTVSFSVFRISQPDSFTGPGFFNIQLSERWISNVNEVKNINVTGTADLPFTRQWTGRIKLWYPITQMVLWGMSPPLGLLSLLGLITAIWLIFKRRNFIHVILISWILVYFINQGTLFVMTMRYYLPIYPVLMILGAWLLFRLYDRQIFLFKNPRFQLTKRKVLIFISFICLSTFFWAIAFCSIYSKPHSRVEASRWIYDNIPKGSSIAVEHWDDSLPLNFAKQNCEIYKYKQISMTWYETDSREKLARALGWLDESDYIAISSNRLYGSIPRLPLRYPMTILYYNSLFNGTLGFKRVAAFSSYPTIFGIEIPDQSAEEAFSVYDHPLVQIFKKTSSYSSENAENILGSVDFSTVIHQHPNLTDPTRKNLMFSEKTRLKYEEFGSWSEIFNKQSFANKYPLLMWVFILFLFGIIFIPYMFIIGKNLPDRGFVFSKILGLLSISWLVWLFASFKFLSFSRQNIWLILSIFIIGSAIIFYKKRQEIFKFSRINWKLLLCEEALFWILFAIFIFIRWNNPDLWHPHLGGEKPMDFAYLNATLKSRYFPPFDPWFSGSFINYYYFGFVLTATLIKLTGIVPYVSYNLAIPTYFAMTALGVWSIVLALIYSNTKRARKIKDLLFPFLGVIFVTVMGNFQELILIARLIMRKHWLPFTSDWWFWNATRVIDHSKTEAAPINEFPFFTFLFADLHAHLMALPLTLLALGITISILHDKTKAKSLVLNIYRCLPFLTSLSLVIGSLWVVNAWDFPTYLTIAIFAIAFSEWSKERQFNKTFVLHFSIKTFILLLLNVLLFLPFRYWYGAGYSSIELWKGSRTPFSDYLVIYGFFIFIILSTVFVVYINQLLQFTDHLKSSINQIAKKQAEFKNMYRLLLSVATVLPVGAFILLGLTLPALIYLTAVVAFFISLNAKININQQLTLILISISFALTLFAEMIVLKGDIGRMNTVFKFYLQAWVLMGISSAVCIPLIIDKLTIIKRRYKWCWLFIFILLLCISCLYPPLATIARIKNRFNNSTEKTLNGMAYMKNSIIIDRNKEIELKYDMEAIHWFLDNVKGSPVIAEANTQPKLYGWGNRFSVYTGLPSVIGWDWHQRQQKTNHNVLSSVTNRIQDLRKLYVTTSIQEALSILMRHKVQYIIVGELERAYYGENGLNKFRKTQNTPWELVYSNEKTSIYKIQNFQLAN